ncbi:unnamed protein product [Ixodes pacificus]
MSLNKYTNVHNGDTQGAGPTLSGPAVIHSVHLFSRLPAIHSKGQLHVQHSVPETASFTKRFIHCSTLRTDILLVLFRILLRKGIGERQIKPLRLLPRMTTFHHNSSF